MDEPVKFDAEVRQIKSMADGSFNLIEDDGSLSQVGAIYAQR